MTYRWLVTDLDGTLVDRRLRMVPRSREALRRFRAGGGEVVIATGRSRESAAPYYAELNLTGPAILLNGALICDLSTGEVLLDRRLPAPVWAAATELLDALDGDAAGVAFRGGQAFRVVTSPLIDAYAARDRVTVEAVGDWSDLPPTEVSKAMIVCASTAVAERVTEKAAALDVTVVVSEPTYVELLPSGVDKGTALTWLTGHWGVPLDQVAAVGDNPNDIPMLRVAGLGAAVGDGHPAVRAAADVVVGGCDDGAVADVIAQILDGAERGVLS
ncbi:MAG: HAD family phosphatase [Hamadaea sp.]|nr:HAD family phosphatase [Hamadaea sp.]NUR50567.1 HAD family phosphatase [Hamadaea sp.]NUT06267.1 HAD family phosphatase [Hamadaea sp.]